LTGVTSGNFSKKILALPSFPKYKILFLQSYGPVFTAIVRQPYFWQAEHSRL